MVTVVTKDTFKEEVLDAKIPVVLDCYADWCGPCKMMAPVVEELSEKLGDQVKFCKLNVDTDIQPIMQYRVVSIPDFLFFKNGEMIHSEIGASDAASFESAVRKTFAL